MNPSTGNAYIRDNEWFRSRNIVKFGVTSYAKDRTSIYITGEPLAGEYICYRNTKKNEQLILCFIFNLFNRRKITRRSL